MGKKDKRQKGEIYEKSEFEDKPLKMVLKVGGSETSLISSSPVPDAGQDGASKKHKHKKDKKKKKKHKHDREHRQSKRSSEVAAFSEDSSQPADYEPPAKKLGLAFPPRSLFPPTPSSGSPSNMPTSAGFAPSPAPAFPSLLNEDSNSGMSVPFQGISDKQGTSNGLQACISYLQRTLKKKDVNGFFAAPVTDAIAPGYSKMIPHPMDFLTMQGKVDAQQYTSVNEYRRDFRLMCDNCCIYNSQETIYYKEAKRLLGIGNKQMSKDKLLHMRKTLPFMSDMSYEELGIELEDLTMTPGDVSRSHSPAMGPGQAREQASKLQPKLKKKKIGPFEAFPDDLTAEEILSQAQEAASQAASKLSLRQPNSKIGFLRRREDGTTTLNVINPDNSGIISEKERVVNLGSLVGKLSHGSGNMASFKEDKRNKVTPAMYMNYGPFSSHGPCYDSSFSTICKEDSDLLLATYGDETGTQYAKSISSFVEDAGDFAIKMVDNLLDVLTHGDHSKYLAQTRQNEESADISADDSSLSQLTQQQTVLPLTVDAGSSEIQAELEQASQLLSSLEQVQHDRMSRPLPPHLALIPGPSTHEINLASKVTRQLTSLTKQVAPSDIMSVDSLHQALGITLHPSNMTSLIMHPGNAPSDDGSQLSPTTTADNAMECASNVSSAFIGAESVDSPMTDMIGLD